MAQSGTEKNIEKVNLKSAAGGLTELFRYLEVGRLNDHMLNIVVAENRTLDFHAHEDSDEMFYIIEGRMRIDFEDRAVDLAEGDFIIVPGGVSHRPVCTVPVKTLLIEKAGTLTPANTGGTYRP
ncbi:MAG: cupin domain-containing protein [Spirochaetes bacterium]|nr:cupin domain-containing protein [Spirochaetota bacterium]